MKTSIQRQYRILAVFLHDYQYGKVLGGVERRFVEVTRCFPRYGVQTIALEFPPSIGKALLSSYTSIPIRKEKYRSTLEEAIQLARLSALSLIWGRRFKCDLVYSPSGVYSQVIPAFFASFVLKKPLIIVFHSLPKGSHLSFVSSFKSRLTRGDSIRKALFRATIQALRRRAYKSASVHVAVSRDTAEQIQMTMAPRNLIVSGNGVGDEWFSNERLPKLNDGCFLGRISPRKGVDLLLRAWEIVVHERPDAKLVLIGGGEDSSYVRGCHETIKRLGLENNVTMPGFLDDNAVRETLSSSRLFVLPSKREGFGLAVVEAMARGVPCILSELPSLRENFEDSALFVDGADPEVWAHSILHLLTDETYMSRLSEYGKAKARNFRWDAVASREATIIRTAIGPRT